MTYKLAWVFAATSLLVAKKAVERPEQTSNTECVDFAPGGTIRFNNSFGDLNVDGWDQPQVEMTLIKSFDDYQPPKDAAARLEAVKFTTDHPSPNELAIGTTIPPHSFFRHPFGGKGPVTVRYELRVPSDSHLVIHHGGGNILIGNITGSIEATNREGDIVLMLPTPGPYAIDAKSKIGTVTSDFTGQVHVRHFIGERFAGADANSRAASSCASDSAASPSRKFRAIRCRDAASRTFPYICCDVSGLDRRRPVYAAGARTLRELAPPQRRRLS